MANTNKVDCTPLQAGLQTELHGIRPVKHPGGHHLWLTDTISPLASVAFRRKETADA